MQEYMNLAIKEAIKAYKKDEVPVGAIIVRNNKIIAKAHNLKEQKQCVTEHAEMIAIKKASNKLKTWHLDDCEMYVTLEPCKMCCGAIEQSRIKKVYYGAESYIYGNVESNVSRETLDEEKKNNVSRETYVKIPSKEASKIMTDFFKTKRK